MIKELRDKILSANFSYNLPFTENGVACTTVTVIAAILGYRDIDDLDETQIQKIRQLHVLLAMFNAWQPGVFALSGWDLVGATTIDPGKIPELLVDGDTRWINRGAYDLIDKDPEAIESFAKIPKALSLYGSLPDQLDDGGSFARQLQSIIAVRDEFGIAYGDQIAIPEVSHKGLLVMVHRIETGDLQVTVLNFSADAVPAVVSSEHFSAGAAVIDMVTSKEVAIVDQLSSFPLEIDAYQGMSLLIRAA